MTGDSAIPTSHPATGAEPYREAVAALCHPEEAIVCAFLFGSCAQGCSSPSSDLDVALLLDEERAQRFDQLSFAVQLERQCGRRVDLVILNRAGETLKYEVRRTGILVFERDPGARKRFEVLGRKTYEDFLHLHQKYVRRTLYGR